MKRCGYWLLMGLLLTVAWWRGGHTQSASPKAASSPQKPSRLQLIHADVSRGVERKGIPLRILEGHVHIQQDTLHLYCDRAIYNPTARTVVLEGNVRLQQGKTVLTAHKITYWEDTRKAIAEGNVRLTQPGRELRTPYLIYYYETDAARAEQMVTIVDDSQRVVITARRGEYRPEEHLAFVEQQAHFMQVDSTESDTLHIFAHRLAYYFRPQRVAIASQQVRVLQNNMEATCDSIIYRLEDSTAVLRVQPVARQEGNQLMGEAIMLHLTGNRVRQITVRGNKAHAVSVADSLQGWENQLDGKIIQLYLHKGQLDYLEAIQQASSLYYVEDKGKWVGKNTASADTIRVFFQEGKVDSIVVKGGAEGIYAPLDGASQTIQEKP